MKKSVCISRINDKNSVCEDIETLLDIMRAKSKVENLVRPSVNKWWEMKEELYKKETKEVSDKAIVEIFSQFKQSFTHNCSLLTYVDIQLASEK